MSDLKHIASNIEEVRAKIRSACLRVGRSPDEVTLIAVTKTHPVDVAVAAFHAGVTDCGENKVQEALPKIEAISSDLSLAQMKWHLIGHLQTNKAKQAAENFDLIHSMDSVRLALELNKHAGRLDRMLGVLMQVNVSGEASKGGFEPGETRTALEVILEECPNLTVQGFMTMAPFISAEEARPSFKGLRELRDEILSNVKHPRFTGSELSMGMSNDYEVAIEEGATMVRVGSSIFGQRGLAT